MQPVDEIDQLLVFMIDGLDADAGPERHADVLGDDGRFGGSAVAVTLSTPGQNGTLTFSGTASQQVTVRLTSNLFGWVTVRLLKPDGSTLASQLGFGNINLAQTLPSTGTYTIVIDPSAAAVGSVNVAVTSP